MTTQSELRKTRRGQWERRGGGILLDAAELAEKLGESERSIRSWRQSGVIPSLVLGYTTYRYRLEDVLHALERRAV